jgi:hypothetical protein
MSIVVPDLVSNSYFPALAAEDVGYYATEGLEAHVEVFSPQSWPTRPLVEVGHGAASDTKCLEFPGKQRLQPGRFAA